jgi:mannose-6-phosphate isomerase-like protein (cupin superfamily)
MAIASAVVVKRFEDADETRPFKARGRVEIVDMGGQTIGRGTFEPGWKWSNDVKPIAGTESCQFEHLSYCASGRMLIHMDDGTDHEIGPGDVMLIPPGHDAEVLGDEPCVMIDVVGDDADYAKPS